MNQTLTRHHTSSVANRDKLVLVMQSGDLEHCGGIGRVMGYMIDAWREEDGPRTLVIDTRGRRHIALSPIAFARAIAQVLGAVAVGKVRLMHINLSTHGSVYRKFILSALARAVGVRYLIHLHGSRFDVFVRGLPRVGKRLVRRMLEDAETVVVLGEYWRRLLVEELGVSADKVRIIFNGVPMPPRLAEGSAAIEGAPHILFLGQLGARKGVPELLESLAHPAMQGLAWRATIAGNGDVERYRADAQRLGIADRVAFPGWVDRAAVQNLLFGADVVVLPSHNEGLPMSVIEGLANRIAVVCTPVGATAEIVADGTSGLLVPPGDAPALARALARVVADGDLRRQLAEAGHATFLAMMEAKGIARTFARIYEEIDARG